MEIQYAGLFTDFFFFQMRWSSRWYVITGLEVLTAALLKIKIF
jgi:hypothetical protein